MVKRPRVLERTSSKSSFLHPKHVKTCSMPLADISACLELVSYCPSLLQLQPSLIQLIPSTRNSVPENTKQKCSLLLIACISDVSAAHNYGSLLVPSIYSWRNKGRGFSSVSIQRKAHLFLFRSLFCWVPWLSHLENVMISPGSQF